MSEIKRSHPPALRKSVKKTLQNNCSVSGKKLLIGVSGGSDSMALLHVLATLREELNFELYAVGVNHNLREEAESELDVAENFAKSLNIEFFKKNVFIEGSNIQEKARDARYAAIREVKDQIEADLIVTAHHMEDRAETVLMRIIRGTSVKGLGVLLPQDGDLLRPMINCRKRDVMLHIERKSIPYCEDPSNKNTKKYTRSKMRYELIPELQKLNPDIVLALCSLSDSSFMPEVSGKRIDRKRINVK